MKKIVIGLAVLLASFVPMVLSAQQTGTEPASPAIPPARMKAAIDLYNLVGGSKVSETAANSLLSTLEQNPSLAPYKDILEKWTASVYAGKEFQNSIIELYAESFTESELNALADFYRTPLGQKSLRLLPELSQKSAKIGMDAARAHLPELQAMIQERQKELQQQGSDSKQ